MYSCVYLFVCLFIYVYHTCKVVFSSSVGVQFADFNGVPSYKEQVNLGMCSYGLGFNELEPWPHVIVLALVEQFQLRGSHLEHKAPRVQHQCPAKINDLGSKGGCVRVFSQLLGHVGVHESRRNAITSQSLHGGILLSEWVPDVLRLFHCFIVSLLMLPQGHCRHAFPNE